MRNQKKKSEKTIGKHAEHAGKLPKKKLKTCWTKLDTIVDPPNNSTEPELFWENLTQ